MGYTLDTLLGAYGLKPVNLDGQTEIDIQRLPTNYKEAFACIFYPKTLIDIKDINYLEKFWDKRRERLKQYVELIKFYDDNEIAYNDTSGIFSISIIISHFKPIKRIMGISTVDNRGNLLLRAIILPESYAVDRILDIFYQQPLKLVNRMTENPAIKFAEDAGLFIKTDRPFILILDANELSSLFPIKIGSILGKCDCIEGMIAVYIQGVYYLVIIEKSVWFEFILTASDISNLTPLTHVLLRKIQLNTINSELKRIPLQFIISNISNCRSIDMLNYDAIADAAIRQTSIVECMEYCLLQLKSEYGSINQVLFYKVVDKLYPNIQEFYLEGNQTN